MRIATMDTTEGFTQEDLDLINEAILIVRAKLFGDDFPDYGDGISKHEATKIASDIVFNNWMAEGNTIETLTNIYR